MGCLSARVQGFGHLTEKRIAAHFFFDNHSFVGCWKEQNNKSDMEKEESEILKELQYQNRKKNILVSLILVFFFGPLGLFYTNSIKALCMLLLLLVTIPLSIFRIYSNLIEFRITDELILWCVFFCMYWLTLWAMSVVEVNNYNAILQSRLGCKRI